MKLHKAAFEHAKKLIKDGKYKLDTSWSDAQPSASEENRFLDQEGWDTFNLWYMGIDTDESEQTKSRQQFPYGDFKQVHRSGVIAAKQRAAQYDYGDIEKAADDLLQMIDEREGEKA